LNIFHGDIKQNVSGCFYVPNLKLNIIDQQ